MSEKDGIIIEKGRVTASNVMDLSRPQIGISTVFVGRNGEYRTVTPDHPIGWLQARFSSFTDYVKVDLSPRTLQIQEKARTANAKYFFELQVDLSVKVEHPEPFLREFGLDGSVKLFFQQRWRRQLLNEALATEPSDIAELELKFGNLEHAVESSPPLQHGVRVLSFQVRIAQDPAYEDLERARIAYQNQSDPVALLAYRMMLKGEDRVQIDEFLGGVRAEGEHSHENWEKHRGRVISLWRDGVIDKFEVQDLLDPEKLKSLHRLPPRTTPEGLNPVAGRALESQGNGADGIGKDSDAAGDGATNRSDPPSS